MDPNTFDLLTLESFRARREAMSTKNQERAWNGDPPAYQDLDFFSLEHEILAFRNSRQ